MDQQQFFVAAMEQLSPALRRISRSFAVSAEESEDLFQDMLLAIWMAGPKYASRSSIKTYVFRIAQNVALKAWLKRKKRNEIQKCEDFEFEDPSPCQLDQVLVQEKRDKLLNAIQCLNLSAKQVLTLFLEDLTTTEIAEILSISENAVLIRLSRAKDQLRQFMGERS